MVAATSASAPADPSGGPARPDGPAVVDQGTVAHESVRAGRWTVHGIAKVAGDVETGTAELVGTVIVGGRLSAGELSARGSLEARGPLVVAGRLRAHGSLETAAPVRAREAELDGSVRLAGELATEENLVVRGSLRAPSVACGGVLDLRGSAMVPGTVAARAIDAMLVDDSSLGVLQCHELRLRGPAPNVVRRLLGGLPTATVERIEADTVLVENVRVRFVRAAHVELGRNAHVATVEGTVERSHRSSRLGPESWSRPPLGLTR